MLLPSAIQRSDDLVGMATPMVPLSPAPELLPPHAARLRARAAPATPAINLRTDLLPFVARPAGALPGRSFLACADIQNPCASQWYAWFQRSSWRSRRTVVSWSTRTSSV